MSRKTRQQKIIADLRRQLAQQKKTETAVSLVKQTVNKFDDKSKDNWEREDNEPVVDADRLYIKNNLLKTFGFTVLAIGAQIVLWYFLVGR